MNILVQPQKAKVEPGQHFVLWQIGWDAYEKFIEAMAEHNIRTTYDRGDLELTSSLPKRQFVLAALRLPGFLSLAAKARIR